MDAHQLRVLVAYLWSQHEMDGKTIARRLGISYVSAQQIISRWKKEGRLKLVREMDFTDEEEQFARNWQQNQDATPNVSELLKKLSSNPKLTLDIAPPDVDEEFYSYHHRTFLTVLNRVDPLIGLAGGAIVGTANDPSAMKERRAIVKPIRRAKVTFVVLWGRTLGVWLEDPYALKSELVRGPSETTLMSDDAFRPPLALEASRERDDYLGVKKLARTIEMLGCVVGEIRSSDDPGWAEGLSQLLRGIHSPEVLKAMFLGDIGGTLIPRHRPEETEEEKTWCEQVQRRWTGMTIQQYQFCVKRTVFASVHGSVVFCRGKTRAEVFLAAVKLGLISRAFIDTELLNAVDRLLIQESHTTH